MDKIAFEHFITIKTLKQAVSGSCMIAISSEAHDHNFGSLIQAKCVDIVWVLKEKQDTHRLPNLINSFTKRDLANKDVVRFPVSHLLLELHIAHILNGSVSTFFSATSQF